MAVIHHLALGVESEVPDRTVPIWQRSGWAEGPLPVDPPPTISDPSDDPPLDVKLIDGTVVTFADLSVDESPRL